MKKYYFILNIVFHRYIFILFLAEKVLSFEAYNILRKYIIHISLNIAFSEFDTKYVFLNPTFYYVNQYFHNVSLNS